MSNDYPISEENAVKEFNKILEYYEVEPEDFDNPTTQESFNALKKQIVKGFRKGKIEVKEDRDNGLGFCIIQNRKNGDSITYREMNGRAKTEMNKKKENDTSGQCYAMLGSLSGLGEGAIASLTGPDLKRAEYIGALLLFC